MRRPLTPIMDPKFNWSRSHNTANSTTGLVSMPRWKHVCASRNIRYWMWEVNHELALHTMRLDFRLGLQNKRKI